MIMELPRKFNSQYVSCTGDFLKIHQIVRFEELMYELAKAIKGKRCIYCGKKLKESNYTLDHRYPRDTGGVSITNNLFPCCEICNSAKGNLTHNEYLEIIGLSKRDKKKIVKDIFAHNDIIMKKIGFKLPRRWVEFQCAEKVHYIDPKCFNKGKKYRNIATFYKRNHRIPRPVIVDRNFNLLEGYNIILFAKEMDISEIPMIVLENVEVET